MTIYNDYLSDIKAAIRADRKAVTGIREGLSGFTGDHFAKAFNYQDFRKRTSEKRLLPSLQTFASQLRLTANFEQQLGLHPDFAHLKGSDETENHYIASMFVDIKGSTNLFKKYTPETVLVITNTLQRAAIHTCLIFGGYIHRLQGDGLFVYYGRKGLDISEALMNALQSASVFSYFVKHDLKKLFNEQGIDEIFTRIGIDLGFDADVIWAMAGIGEISEVTTCSLHTSLASKMQGHAESNGIVVGDNIVRQLPALKPYFSPVCQRTKNESDRYIFRIPEESFNYTQHDFNWLSFLKTRDFIVTDLTGNLTIKTRQDSQTHFTDNIKPIAVQSKPYYSS